MGVGIGSTVGTYVSIQIARRMIQKNLLEWISEVSGSKGSEGLLIEIRDDFAEAIGKAVAEELKEKRREGSESNGEDR